MKVRKFIEFMFVTTYVFMLVDQHYVSWNCFLSCFFFLLFGAYDLISWGIWLTSCTDMRLSLSVETYNCFMRLRSVLPIHYMRIIKVTSLSILKQGLPYNSELIYFMSKTIMDFFLFMIEIKVKGTLANKSISWKKIHWIYVLEWAPMFLFMRCFQGNTSFSEEEATTWRS